MTTVLTVEPLGELLPKVNIELDGWAAAPNTKAEGLTVNAFVVTGAGEELLPANCAPLCPAPDVSEDFPKTKMGEVPGGEKLAAAIERDVELMVEEEDRELNDGSFESALSGLVSISCFNSNLKDEACAGRALNEKFSVTGSQSEGASVVAVVVELSSTGLALSV